MIAVERRHVHMWTLNTDRRSIRMNLPPVKVAGLLKPISVNIDFDAGSIDQMIERLSVLRAQMLPAPPKPGARN
jgi:hypothetical protein